MKTTLKFFLAFALCYWLFKNGQLDFSLVTKTLNSGYLWVFAITLLVARLFIANIRCQILLETKSENKISFSKLFAFNAIGNFFSVILPGSSAGDVIKFFYFRNLDKSLSATTVASIIALDRFVGLLGLLGIGIFICCFQYQSIMALNPALLTFIIMNVVLFAGLGIFIVVIFSNLINREKLVSKLTHYLARWPKILGPLIDMLSIRLSFKPFFYTFMLSVLNQLLLFICIWLLIKPFIPLETSVLNIFSILPIGMIGAALPITPAGLGVGHVLFENLFKMLQIDHGASLFNLFFIANTLVNLTGVIPYLFVKSELKDRQETP
ncbi:hypothetical protein DOM21_17070 [Bacteriovorax stolpii]|uniref:lysylphosphatidylglycerol synthase transmembrane domain-containing protein n=1 Tax=Bacteriovorax stolpii TaxID=960 RepID=UPI00115B9090|nr:lysylphosphatidylglycerol synthase transmembrane domain-containing protein [Bacteriovorax stolpii]QDK43134.1 hypothetical protein DOM21_17070 [Bacteriovorax stolpii]